MSFSESMPNDVCPSPFQIIVNYDGSIYPCCSVSGFSKHLSLGNITSSSLEQALEIMLKKPFLYYIQRRGFSELLSVLENEGKFTVPKTLITCDLCAFVTSNDDVFKVFNERSIEITINHILGVLNDNEKRMTPIA